MYTITCPAGSTKTALSVFEDPMHLFRQCGMHKSWAVVLEDTTGTLDPVLVRMKYHDHLDGRAPSYTSIDDAPQVALAASEFTPAEEYDSRFGAALRRVLY